MKSIRIDIVNKQFGKLIVTDFLKCDGRRSFWLCVCDCGKTTVVSSHNLRSGKTKSCGCLIKTKLGNIEGAYLHDKQINDKFYSYWESYIRIEGRLEFLGSFRNRELANRAFLKAKKKMNKENE